MAEYDLYCFAQSGNAYKPALMMELVGADWSPIFVDFFNGGSRTPEFLAINPMGEIPVLRHGDRTLTQSGVMLHHISERFDNAYGGKTAQDKDEIWRWLLWDNHKLTANTATLRFLRMFAKTGETPVTEFLQARAVASFKVLNMHLEGRDWIVGENPTLADLSVCGYLFWPDEIGVDFGAYTNINAWLERIKALPGWVHPYELMPGYPLPEKA